MSLFDEDLEKLVWLALAGVIVGVAAVLIFWFPLERRIETTEGLTFKPRKESAEQFKAEEALRDLSRLMEEALRRGEKFDIPRDPFLSRQEIKWLKFAEEVSLNPPTLQGVVEREGSRYALIKGKLLGVGERIEGFLIEGIESEMVVLSKEGKKVTVRLPRAGGLP